MKKILTLALCAFLFLSLTIMCVAGDIPESLLYDKRAPVYFGEVKAIDNGSITIIQRKKIQGDFSENREITYSEFSVTKSPEVGKVYLCGFIDDNNPLYIWKITSLYTKDLKILNEDDLSKRIQKYLNQGDFDSFSEDASSVIIDKSKILYTESRKGTVITTALIIISAVLILAVVIIMVRKRVKSNQLAK